jgi:ribonuclease Z
MSQRCLVILGCSSQQHTRTRNHGAYLLLWKTEGFLFDPGEGTQGISIFSLRLNLIMFFKEMETM